MVRKTNKPVDIIYYSDEEWDGNESLIIREAKRTGKIIYPQIKNFGIKLKTFGTFSKPHYTSLY